MLAVSFGVSARASWRSRPLRSASAASRRSCADTNAPVTSWLFWVRERTCASFDRRASASSSRRVGTRSENVAPAVPESPLDTEEVTTIPPTASVARITPSETSPISSAAVSRVRDACRSTRRARPGASLSSVAGGAGSATAPPVLGAPAALSPPSERCCESSGRPVVGWSVLSSDEEFQHRGHDHQPHQQRRRRPERRQQHPPRRARAQAPERRDHPVDPARRPREARRRAPHRAEPRTPKRSRAAPPARPAPARRDRPGRDRPAHRRARRRGRRARARPWDPTCLQGVA